MVSYARTSLTWLVGWRIVRVSCRCSAGLLNQRFLHHLLHPSSISYWLQNQKSWQPTNQPVNVFLFWDSFSSHRMAWEPIQTWSVCVHVGMWAAAVNKMCILILSQRSMARAGRLRLTGTGDTFLLNIHPATINRQRHHTQNLCNRNFNSRFPGPKCNGTVYVSDLVVE